MATALIVADTVLLSATVELKVPVATPLAFVVPTGWVTVLPVPVAASTTVAPGIGLDRTSVVEGERVDLGGRRVIIIEDGEVSVDVVGSSTPWLSSNARLVLL